MSRFHYGRRSGYRSAPERPTFEGLIETRIPARAGPTLAQQLVADFEGDALAQACLGKGAILSQNDYWGLNRYALPDKSVVVLQRHGGPPMTVDATDSESIKAYCSSLKFDSREVYFFAALM